MMQQIQAIVKNLMELVLMLSNDCSVLIQKGTKNAVSYLTGIYNILRLVYVWWFINYMVHCMQFGYNHFSSGQQADARP